MALTLCVNVFMPPHICAVCLFYEKRRLCVLSNILTVAFPDGLPVEINNPVPASQVRFQKFRIIERSFIEREQTTRAPVGKKVSQTARKFSYASREQQQAAVEKHLILLHVRKMVL